MESVQLLRGEHFQNRGFPKDWQRLSFVTQAGLTGRFERLFLLVFHFADSKNKDLTPQNNIPDYKTKGNKKLSEPSSYK